MQLVLVQKQTVGMVTLTVTMVTCWCVFYSFILACCHTDNLVMVTLLLCKLFLRCKMFCSFTNMVCFFIHVYCVICIKALYMVGLDIQCLCYSSCQEGAKDC